MEEKVRITGIKETLIILDAVEPQAIKEMKSSINSVVSASGVFQSIRAKTPTVAPLSGMAHNGPTQWGGVKSVRTAIAPITLARMSSQGRNIPLVSIVATGGNQALGFDYAELAGIRRRPPRPRSKIRGTATRGSMRGDGSIAINGQGDNMIQVLKDRFGKPGRFAYSGAFDKRRQIQLGIQKTLDFYAAKINRKLR